MTQSLRLKLFIKGVFVGSWGRKQVLENSHQEASQKVLSKAILGGGQGGGERRVSGASLHPMLGLCQTFCTVELLPSQHSLWPGDAGAANYVLQGPPHCRDSISA